MHCAETGPRPQRAGREPAAPERLLWVKSTPLSDLTSSARPGRATSYDVAAAAGVAQSTVSRCFQPDSRISQATRERVLAVAARLGYVPNVLARSLITGQSHAVGLVITRYTLHGLPGLLYALGDALSKARKRLVLLAVDDDEAVTSALADVQGYPLDGLISCATLEEAHVARFLSHGVPVLFFNRSPGRAKADSISTHHARGAGRLAEALLAAGHRRFLCMGGPAQAPVNIARMNGFIAALRKAGVEPIGLLNTDFSYQGGHDSFLQAAASGTRPDCVFCANDAMAMGVMDACRFSLGWRIPEDLAVAGFDDVPEAARPSYRLTTVRQPIEHMAEQAVRLLEARIAQPDSPPRTIHVDGTVIARASAPIAPIVPAAH
jgi:DNA-binding LacI/PurR family transcriptional regulator